MREPFSTLRDGYQPTMSRSRKKNLISLAAVSAASEPCTELASIDSANSLRIVPGAALAGLGAAPTSRLLAMGFSPFSTRTTPRAPVLNLAQSLEKGGPPATP